MQAEAAQRWPYRPYCTDELSTGIRPRPLEHAIRCRYIQANPPAFHARITFDLDCKLASHVHEFAEVAPPNQIVVNPENGHAHYLYELEAPVCRTDAARPKPIRYLAAVEAAYRDALSADPGYSGLIVKNPWHPSWETYQLRPQPYDLAELSEYVDLRRPWTRAEPHKITGLGVWRNVTLFENLRQWAYQRVDEYRMMGVGMRGAWDEAVLQRAEALNCFTEPLPYTETKATARSVARWVWERFWGKAESDRRFSELQRKRARRKGASKRAAGQKMLDQGCRVTDIAEALNVDRTTVWRWSKALDVAKP